ncbi:MAG TPA: S-adenosylmethionine:tRNA ribosyltransferase-isomerase, partial [Chitinophagaceae bacterium]|nr:S-adenosylmethionine:tRNA ribosyltransferase-isomerase [Chitinophagaceae bacterium]
YPDITTAMRQKGHVLWQCLVGGASKWKKGQLLKKEIRLKDDIIILTAAYIEKSADTFTIELSWSPGKLSFAEILHHAGAIPLPPYIKRKAELSDTERYQTIYAEQDGSVAAPTAGLHFTDHIFHTLQQKGIEHLNVTLHVGAGTFKPVTAEKMQDHIMHAEYIDVSIEVLKKVRDSIGQKKIVAVGTTSLRTIETLYWAGLKCITGNKETSEITQWEPYLPHEEVSAKEALDALVKDLENKNQKQLITKTRLLIAPGYNFKIISGLITNFHQPGSTLLLLVAALTGDNWKKIYDHALNNGFRFLSYGDGCFLWRD